MILSRRQELQDKIRCWIQIHSEDGRYNQISNRQQRWGEKYQVQAIVRHTRLAKNPHSMALESKNEMDSTVLDGEEKTEITKYQQEPSHMVKNKESFVSSRRKLLRRHH